MKIVRKIVPAVLSVSMILSMTTVAFAKNDKVVLRVGDQELTADELNTFVRISQAQNYDYYKYIYSMYGMNIEDTVLWDQDYTEAEADAENLAETEKEATDETESETGSETKADTKKKVDPYDLIMLNAPETTGDKLVNDTVVATAEMLACAKYFKERGVEPFDSEISEIAEKVVEANDPDTLKEFGATYDTFKKYLYLNGGYYGMRDQLSVLAESDYEVPSDGSMDVASISYAEFSAENLTPEATASETEAEAGEEVDYGEMAKATAEDFLKKVKSSEDAATVEFQTLAEDYDVTPYCGKMGIYKNDEYNQAPAEVVEASKGLKDGELYDGVITVGSDYYVIRMDAVRDETITEEYIDEQKNNFGYDKAQETIDNWLAEEKIFVDKDEISKIKVTDKDKYIAITYESDETESEDAWENETEADIFADAGTEDTEAADNGDFEIEIETEA